MISFPGAQSCFIRGVPPPGACSPRRQAAIHLLDDVPELAHDVAAGHLVPEGVQQPRVPRPVLVVRLRQKEGARVGKYWSVDSPPTWTRAGGGGLRDRGSTVW